MQYKYWMIVVNTVYKRMNDEYRNCEKYTNTFNVAGLQYQYGMFCDKIANGEYGAKVQSYADYLCQFLNRHFSARGHAALDWWMNPQDLFIKLDDRLNAANILFSRTVMRGEDFTFANSCKINPFEITDNRRSYHIELDASSSGLASYLEDQRKPHIGVRFDILEELRLTRIEHSRNPTFWEKLRRRLLAEESGQYVNRPVVTHAYIPTIRIYDTPGSYYELTFEPAEGAFTDSEMHEPQIKGDEYDRENECNRAKAFCAFASHK